MNEDDEVSISERIASWDDAELVWHAERDALDGDELEAVNDAMRERGIDVEAVYGEED